jgi:hypothetical protein
MLVLSIGCGHGGKKDGADDPERPGLAFANVPAAARLNGLFEVWARVNDALGNRTDDSQTIVTIRVSGGGGALSGTLSKRAVRGMVVFDDLAYDRWEPITLTLSAFGFDEVSTRSAVPVRPLMRLLKMPPAHVPADSPVGPFDLELVDGRGHSVHAAQPVTLADAEGVEATNGVERSFADGLASYGEIFFHAPGARTLVWRSAGLADLIFGITVHDGEDTDVLWLPAARVGAPYHAQLPDGDEYQLLKGTLPRGLKLEPTGEIHGVPTTSQHAQLEVFALRPGEAPMLWRVELPVFSEVDRAPGPLDALSAVGPFPVGSLDDAAPVPSRGLSEQLRIFFPAAPGGAIADSVFPVVVFHHGALLPDGHPTIFDRFDPLLRHWASYGFVVVSIDAPDLVWQGTRLVNASLSNLAAMSENQRATIAHLRARNTDPSFPLAGHLAMDRVIVAGHSRGGGASIITARNDPSVVAGILIKPLDPMGTVGGEKSWDTPLPAKPFLLLVAGNDGDLPYPLVDFLYERRSGPMVAPTILGALHSFTCATCPPDNTSVAGITREEDWAITNAYAVAFLRFVGHSDVGFGSLLFGAEGLSTHLSALGTLVRSDRGADPLVVDDFQRETPGRNALGLPTTDAQMALSTDESSLIGALRSLPDSYDAYRILYEHPDTLERSMAHRLEWAQDGASYGSALGGLDVRGRAAFVFRIRSESGRLSADKLSVELRDSEGKTALVPASGCAGANGIGERFSDVIVPLAEFRDSGVDLTGLDRVQLVLQGAGAVLIDDLRFE